MSDEQAIERDELTSILRERCDQDFDGECHLTNAEADRIITFLATPPVTGEVGELLNDVFDFLGGVDGASGLRDRILAVLR